jgi:hypothetical protein
VLLGTAPKGNLTGARCSPPTGSKRVCNSSAPQESQVVPQKFAKDTKSVFVYFVPFRGQSPGQLLNSDKGLILAATIFNSILPEPESE